MIQINSQPVPTRTIAPSSESSDNSGHEEYYPDGGRQNHERFEQKKPNASFSGGTIPVESWQTYADLAGIMDAISEIQTKEMFTTMAKEALTRMKNCENDPEPTEYAKQSSLLLDLMSHANVLENSSTETPDHEKQSKLSKFVPDDAGEIDWIGTLEFLDEQQKRLAREKDHLQSQAKAAQHNIEKFNKTDDYCQPMANQSEVNQSTLPELLQAADLAIETQTLHLPRRAVQLINN